MMEILADFASMGVRHRRQQKILLEHAGATAAADMANDLAHKINNPLQGLTNLLFLAAEGPGGKDARELARQAFDDLERLSALVKKLLEVPFVKAG
jgi:nitrogen-specific signal transduction histidine kinase